MESSKRVVHWAEPVSANGIRYEVTRVPSRHGIAQDSGVVSAIDEATGQELWTIAVYPIVYDEDEERDVQDVYITRLAVDPEANVLLVANERRERYRVDLTNRSVTKIN